ncbi:DMT family transporter [Gorillibacterium sp. sgz500922]|uniref:DMT family transporter n=1 Tax=Gorillibacterium sp. sgz500922 TaxID=3446694 RepID=UPI003F672F1D
MGIGMLLAFMAGSLVSLQNIFNSKMNEHNGSWTTTAVVLGLGFAASTALGLLLNGNGFWTFGHLKLWYPFSGLFGIGVVVCLVRAMRLAGPTLAVSLVMTSQLTLALILDSVGAFGLERVPFQTNKLIGVLILIAGVAVFQIRGEMNPLHRLSRKSMITTEPDLAYERKEASE